MSRLARAWQRFFFAPSAPTNLACTRIALYGLLLGLSWTWEFSTWGTFGGALWRPVPGFFFVSPPKPSVAFLTVATWLWRVSLLSACLGVLTRASAAVAFVLGFYLLGFTNNFGFVYHNDAPIVIALGVLAASRPGDALSVDARRRRQVVEASSEYTWPLRMIQILMVMMFVGAGVNKLRASGLAWIDAEPMRYLLVRHHFTHVPPTDLGLWIAEIPSLCFLLAASTVVLELGAPLALFSRRARRFWVPGLLCMQLGIWLTLGLKFFTCMACYAAWVNWETLAPRLRRIGSRRLATSSESRA